jgi:stress-induced-phosphoprotein 1
MKNQGNDSYKKRDFDTALSLYEQALVLNPDEVSYYTNKAAVYFEKKDYAKCIEECDRAIQKSKEGHYDYVKLARALARKANATLQLGNFDEAISLYKDSLLENNDGNVKDQLKKAEKMKKDSEAQMYINPEIAEEHRKKGNEIYE